MDIANKQMLIICESFADMFRKLADSYKDPEQPKPAEAPKAEEKKPETPAAPKALTPAQEDLKKTLDELDRFNASKPKEEGKGKLPDFDPKAAPIVNKASFRKSNAKSTAISRSSDSSKRWRRGPRSHITGSPGKIR
jgi:hypothetical protein